MATPGGVATFHAVLAPGRANSCQKALSWLAGPPITTADQLPPAVTREVASDGGTDGTDGSAGRAARRSRWRIPRRGTRPRARARAAGRAAGHDDPSTAAGGVGQLRWRMTPGGRGAGPRVEVQDLRTWPARSMANTMSLCAIIAPAGATSPVTPYARQTRQPGRGAGQVQPVRHAGEVFLAVERLGVGHWCNSGLTTIATSSTCRAAAPSCCPAWRNSCAMSGQSDTHTGSRKVSSTALPRRLGQADTGAPCWSVRLKAGAG